MLPVGFKWQHQGGVTLLGDAAHLMTPFAGLGVNIAFEDAMKLADAIIDAGKDGKKGALDARTTAFEEDMFMRAKKAERLTDGMMRDMFFSEGAPRSSIWPWALKKATYEIHPLLYPIMYPLVAALVYGVRFWKNLWG
jgi:2-polyprenyl-6-methoxyphenol hydroxylase-like FAD-dependent oxidoreductase